MRLKAYPGVTRGRLRLVLESGNMWAPGPGSRRLTCCDLDHSFNLCASVSPPPSLKIRGLPSDVKAIKAVIPSYADQREPLQEAKFCGTHLPACPHHTPLPRV